MGAALGRKKDYGNESDRQMFWFTVNWTSALFC
jgi:hypothetical protein